MTAMRLEGLGAPLAPVFSARARKTAPGAGTLPGIHFGAAAFAFTAFKQLASKAFFSKGPSGSRFQIAFELRRLFGVCEGNGGFDMPGTKCGGGGDFAVIMLF